MKKMMNRKNVIGMNRYDDVFTEYPLSSIKTFEDKKAFFEIVFDNESALRLYVCASEIVRFRYAYNGVFDADFSYSIDHEGFENKRKKANNPTIQNLENQYVLQFEHFNICFEKSNGTFQVVDNQDNIYIEQSTAQATRSILKGIYDVRTSFKVEKSESFWGLGDKTCALNMRGQKLQNWNSDAFGFHDKLDPLYRTIPFFYGLRQNNAYGIFFDNSYRTKFDFCKSKKNLLTMSADGGELNFYFFFGPSMLNVAQNYHALTGVPELPAMWTLGFHQCRWSYYPQQRVHQVADKFRALQIPCDSLYLDIDYMDGWRVFTWNKEYFPDPKDMIDKLDAQGFHTVVMIDPGVKAEKGYEIYDDGLENNAFCRRSNGEIMVGPVWPDTCVFPDFTNPKVRLWWAEKYKNLYNDLNISGFWNDMNEPAVFQVNALTFPDDVLHDHDGHPTNHKKAHNIYGMQMARSTFEGLKTLKPEKRPFLLTRANYSGGQRFAAIWTGDNVASWEHLRLANIQCQRMSISGFSHCGTDIGGFVNLPSGELLARWLQLAVFHPLMRIHSMGNHADGASMVDDDSVKAQEKFDRQDQEPWSFGDAATENCKKAIEFRYRLLPTIYNEYYKYVTLGTPMLQSMAFAFQADERARSIENSFMFGDLLVNPVMTEGETLHSTYLPAGDWYVFDSTTHCVGNQEIMQKVDADSIPIFVKSGAIVALHPVRQHTREAVGTLTLQIYVGNLEETCKSSFYQDMGEGYDMQATLKHDFEHTISAEKLTLSWTCERGENYVPNYENIVFEIMVRDKSKILKIIDFNTFVNNQMLEIDL